MSAMLLITGQIERVTERQAGRAGGEQWTEHTLVVRDWGQTLYVVAGREMVEAGLPREGEQVALEVGVRSYVKKQAAPKPSSEHEAGHGFTAYRRNAEAEAKMFGAAPSRVAAV